MVIAALPKNLARDGMIGRDAVDLRKDTPKELEAKVAVVTLIRRPCLNEESIHTRVSVASRSPPCIIQSIIKSKSVSLNATADPHKELSSAFCITRGPELLKHTKSTQCLRFRLFKNMSFIPDPGLQMRPASQKVYVVDRVCLGTPDVGVCVVEPPMPKKQVRQHEMNLK